MKKLISIMAVIFCSMGEAPFVFVIISRKEAVRQSGRIWAVRAEIS